MKLLKDIKNLTIENEVDFYSYSANKNKKYGEYLKIYPILVIIAWKIIKDEALKS